MINLFFNVTITHNQYGPSRSGLHFRSSEVICGRNVSLY